MEKQAIAAIGGALVAGITFYAGKIYGAKGASTKEETITKDEPQEDVKAEEVGGSQAKVILLGDVGGTNIRLVLKKVFLDDPRNPGEVIKDSKDSKKPLHSQEFKSFEEAVRKFLAVSNTYSSECVAIRGKQ